MKVDARKSALLGAFLVVLTVAATGYMLLDPEFESHEDITVDTSAPPAELAVQSIRKLRHSDYRLEKRVIVINRSAGTEQERLHRLAIIENSRERYWAKTTLSRWNRSVVAYGFHDEAIGYAKRGEDPWWIHSRLPYDLDRANGLADPRVLRTATVTIERETNRAITLRITDQEALQELNRLAVPAPPGTNEGRETMLLTVRKSDGVPSRIERRIDENDDTDLRVVIRYTDYGNVTAERPKGIGFRIEELVNDLRTPP